MSKGRKKAEAIKVTKEYSIAQISGGFRLDFYEEFPHEVEQKDGTVKLVNEKFSKFYGVLYQALQGFVDDYVGRYSDSVEDIFVRVQEAQKAIEDLKGVIPDSWKVVKVVRG